MKLKEQLSLCKGLNVKIGFSCSFIYCDMNGEKTESTIERLSDKEKNMLIEKRQAKIDHLAKFEHYWEERSKREIKQWENANTNKADDKGKRALEIIAKLKALSLDQLKESLEVKKENDFINTNKSIEKYTKKINKFIPFLEREVLQVYDSIFINTKIIICKGNESGLFLDSEEYLNAVANGYLD